jgi:putative ABC transport system permease protein
MPTAIRTVLRQFRAHPGFAGLTVLVLGLGTGAATTVFTIVDSVVLRPLPYASPDRLVTLWDTNREKGLAHDPLSPVNFMDDRSLPVFEGAAAWWRPSINLIDPGLDPIRVNAIEVSGNLFEVLGVRPLFGEGFPANGPFFAPNQPTIVVSERLWRTRYGSDPTIVGRQLNLNGSAHTVVGVMPPRFHYPDDVDVWQLLQWDLTQHSREAHFMEAVARLAPGTTPEQAQGAIDALALRLQREFATTNRGWGTRLIPLIDEQLGYYRPALIVLFGAVGLLLVIGCLNVACLLLTRALSRDREIAVRIALGASGRQLFTQLMTESLTLSAAGAGLGTAATAIFLPVIVRLSPINIPRLDEATVDFRALGLGLALVTTTTVFFGLVPALVLLRRGIATDLKTEERGSSRGARAIYSVLVAGEVALACTLLVSSALLVRTVSRLMNTPTGVDADPVLTATVQLSPNAYRSWRSVSDGQAAIIEQIRQQPAIQAAGASNFLPLEVGWRLPFGIVGDPPPARPDDMPLAQFHSVSEGYLESMNVPLREGRTFSNFDTPDGAPVVLVNETFARRFLAGRSAVGQLVSTTSGFIGPLGANLFRLPPPQRQGTAPDAALLALAPARNFEIVGVVRDIRNAPLGQVVEPAVYFSMRQFPFRELFLTVRASNSASALSAVRNALRTVAPSVPLGRAETWGERLARRSAEPRLLMTILLFFGGLAGLLAALGVYGLVSWSLALRTRELAIRLTLGAPPAHVGWLIVRQGAVLMVAGVVIGLVLVRAARQVLSSVLYGVSPTDVGSTAIAGLLLLVAALTACIPPAIRAMGVDPVKGLRAD